MKLLVSFVMLFALGLGTTVYATNGQVEVSSNFTDTPPTIDGVFTPGEWPETEAFVIDSPIHTVVYIANDDYSVYFLVDASSYSGDYTKDDLDHCDLALYNNGAGFHSVVNGLQNHTCAATNSSGTPLVWGTTACAGEAKAGFGAGPDKPDPHRFYEFRVPLSSFNASAGDTVHLVSGPEANSLPYDVDGDRHNYWPENANMTELGTWGLLHLAKSDRPIPTVSQWGALSLLVLVGSAALWAMRRRKEFPA